jgi:hypothetical protein
MLLEKLVIPIGFDTGLLLEGIKAIEGLITGAIDRTREWADQLDTLAEVTGWSGDELASWSYIANKAGADTETLSSATVIMVKGLLDSKGALSITGKALQDFGINVLDANGKVRDQSSLMVDISKKYSEFGTQTERVDFLTNIFGRSGAKLVDVFETLANEGGLDKVKEKVRSLGLVLDDGRYEDFQRNLNEVNLTFTGLANAFTGPLLPGAESLLQTFTTWLQSPWIADEIGNIGEKLGTLATDIGVGLQTGNWDLFFADFKSFTGVDIQPLISELGKFAAWVTDVGIPKWKEFVQNAKTGLADFKASSQTETSAISGHWAVLVTSFDKYLVKLGESLGIHADFEMDWKQIGITGLQAVDLIIVGLTRLFDWIVKIKAQGGLLGLLDASSTSVYVPPGASKAPAPRYDKGERAAGGAASGLTWVGEKGPELVSLPTGSYVNNNQASQSMGFDYYKLAAILAVEFAKVRD